MKTLITYSLIVSTGLMAFLSLKPLMRQDFVTPLEARTLDDSSPTEAFTLPVLSPPEITSSDKKKEYHIYFENRSTEAIKAVVRYKAYDGSWTSEGWITLKPGEKQLIGASDETTYYYYAKSLKKRGKVWKGKHRLETTEEIGSKLPFIKQDIWECYHTQMCNTFAVFR